MSPAKSVCLVTGASSGIGFAIAKHLLSEGHTVVVTARRADRLRQLDGADVKPGDLTDPAFQDELEERLYATYGSCGYLFNCAGCIEVGEIETVDIDRITAMLRLNVEATFRLTYKLLKRFKQQGSGHVINISSVLGTKVRPTAGAYAASKYAMEALSEALRMELAGTDIGVTCIEPGLVMTELHNRWEVHPKESMKITDPLTVGDIVQTVKYIIDQPGHVRIPKIMILPRDHVI